MLFERQEEGARAARDSGLTETRRRRETNTETSRKQIKLIPARDETNCKVYIVFSFYVGFVLYFAFLVQSPQTILLSNLSNGSRCHSNKGNERDGDAY